MQAASALSKPILGVEDNFVIPSRLIPCLNALPLPNRQGLLFPFLPISGFSQPPLSEWRRNQLSLAWGWLLSPDSLTTGSHASNRAGLGLCWCRFPSRPPKPHTGPHRAEFGFPPKKTNLPLPLKGEGLGIFFLCLLGLPCSFTTGSHWPNRAGLLLRWCRSPTPPSDRPRIATQGRVWFHRLFLLDFLGGNPASCRSRW